MFVAGCKGAAADCLSQAMLQGADSSSYDPGRTLVFGVWSGGYCGGVLYLLYNRLFPRIFPVTNAAGMVHPRRIPHTIAMVAFDNFVSSPWFFVPSYYVMREWLRRITSGNAWQEPSHIVGVALRTYRSEFWDCMSLTVRGPWPSQTSTPHPGLCLALPPADELKTDLDFPPTDQLSAALHFPPQWSMWIPIHFLTFGGVVPQHLRVHFTAVCSFFTLAAMSALQGRLEQRRQVTPDTV